MMLTLVYSFTQFMKTQLLELLELTLTYPTGKELHTEIIHSIGITIFALLVVQMDFTFIG